MVRIRMKEENLPVVSKEAKTEKLERYKQKTLKTLEQRIVKRGGEN